MIRGGHRDETCKSARTPLVLSCRAGFITTVLAGISLFRACRFDGQSPTTLHTLQRCLYGHHLSRECLFICVHLHAYFGACARRHARNRTRSSMRRNRTVENEISAVPFLCVAIRHHLLCHYLPSAHVIHINHVQLRV